MKDFEKYVNLIRKQAHKYSEKLNVPYEDMEAQGYLIYCECLENFDMSKGASFGTHLFIELKRLGDFGHTYNRQRGILIEDLSDTDYPSFRKSRCYASQIVKTKFNSEPLSDKFKYEFEARENTLQMSDFLESAKEYLSIEAYALIEWIVGRTWDDFTHSKPTIKMAMEKFNMSRNKVNLLWNECSKFWNSEGVLMYY